MDKQTRQQHVLIFPFMAQGHIIPFLALALSIERRFNYQITFINTPLNISKLHSSLPPTSSIRLRSLPFDSALHGLPPGTENTDALPFHLLTRLLQSSFTLEPRLTTLLEDITQGKDSEYPLCIITDPFFSWAWRVAHEFNIFHAIFVTSSGFGQAIDYSLKSNLPSWRVEGAHEFSMQDFPEGGKVHITQMPEWMASADGDDPGSVFCKKVLPEWLNADGALFNTVEELDRTGLGYFRRKMQKPVWAIGPVLNQLHRGEDHSIEGGISWEECKAWLDDKPERSVLYVCFGSQNNLTASLMVEMAKALEACGRFFIWVVRPPFGMELAPEFKAEDWLPAGFENSIQGRGLLVKKWAPQAMILSHGSTGGFISHCGWNSVMEAISYGVPILAWPMAAEQFFNVKLLEGELGIGVELGRGNGCKIKCEDIARKIEMVMGEDEGAKEVKRRACEVRKIIADAKIDEEGQKGSSVRAIGEFFSTAIAIREESGNFTA